MSSCSFGKLNYIENQLQNITRVEVIRSSECMQIFMEENKHGNNGGYSLFISLVFTDHFHEHRNLIFSVQCSVSAPTPDPQPPK